MTAARVMDQKTTQATSQRVLMVFVNADDVATKVIKNGKWCDNTIKIMELPNYEACTTSAEAPHHM